MYDEFMKMPYNEFFANVNNTLNSYYYSTTTIPYDTLYNTSYNTNDSVLIGYNYTTNTPITTTNHYSFSYNNTNYDDIFENYYSTRNILNGIVEDLLKQCEPYSDQDFEDNLYKIILDMLYEEAILYEQTQEDTTFEFSKFSYHSIDKVISKIMYEYHACFVPMEEEEEWVI